MLAGALGETNHDLTLIDQGDHLRALVDHGLRIRAPDGSERRVTGFSATGDAAEAGEQDVVILAVKAHQIAEVVEVLPELLGPGTAVVTVQNGIPWWYFARHGGPFGGRRLETLDPGGCIGSAIAPERIIGCVAYMAASVAEPGVIEIVEGRRFPLGELDGEETERVTDLAAAFEAGGLKARILTDVRSEIWLKALGSLSFNPISALTGATLERICRFPPTRDLAKRMMQEAWAICDVLGVHVRRSIEERIAGAEKVGDHKTSMLQDIESRRQLEHAALVGSIAELGEMTGVPTPYTDAVYACLRLLEEEVTGGTVVDADPQTEGSTAPIEAGR